MFSGDFVVILVFSPFTSLNACIHDWFQSFLGKAGDRKALVPPSQTMPIRSHNFISNQLLGTSLANSATPSTLPLRKPFTLSPKRDGEKKFHLLQLRARSFIIAWVHRLHINFFLF